MVSLATLASMRVRFALALAFVASAVACKGAVDLAYQVMSSESPSPTRVPTRPTAQASGTADPFRSQWVVTGIELGRFRQRYEQRDYSSLYALTDERLRT